MVRTTRKRSRKSGLPPGALVHIGERKADQVKITMVRYDEARVEEMEVAPNAEMAPARERAGVTWINVEGLHDPAVPERIGAPFCLHPLTTEDILNTEQRSKLEVFEDYFFIVIKMLCYDDRSQSVDIDQISIIVGQNFVITFLEKATSLFDPVRQRIRAENSRFRKLGADYLGYSLLDAVVDHYFLVLEKLGERIETLEQKLISEPGPRTLSEVQDLRSDVIYARKAVWPLREVVNEMQRRETPLIRETTVIYLRDVYDHVVQVMDTVETYRDIISEMFDIYLSSIGNRTNEVMKVLTIIATIFIPLTFIVGLYGMNFDFMPELRSPWGYPGVLIVMAVIAALMIVYFRRKGWM